MDQDIRTIKLVTLKPELDDLCHRLGYSNDTLAQELGVSRATIFNWKKDQQVLPRLVSLALFALDVEPRLRKLTPAIVKKKTEAA
jgi:DNA-binding XRE family transcriptional regulator